MKIGIKDFNLISDEEAEVEIEMEDRTIWKGIVEKTEENEIID